MKKVSFIQAMSVFVLMAIAIGVIGGNLNPDNTPAPSMRTLDELYKNIQPGLPSDWKPYPTQSQSAGAGSVHLRIEGTFPIQGGCEAEMKEGSIVVVGLGHEVNLPYDSSTGQATGRRVHSPFVITKYVDRASPKLYQALAEGRNMDLTVQYYRIDPSGVEEHYFTMELQNARIVNMRMAYPNLEQVSFAYERIRWTYNPDGIMYEDNWRDPL